MRPTTLSNWAFQPRIINTTGLANDVSPDDGHDSADLTDKSEAFPRKSPLVPCWTGHGGGNHPVGRVGSHCGPYRFISGTKSKDYVYDQHKVGLFIWDAGTQNARVIRLLGRDSLRINSKSRERAHVPSMPIASHHQERFYRRQGNGKERSASLDTSEALPPTQSRLSIAISRPDSASISGPASSIHTLDTTARRSTIGVTPTVNSTSTSSSAMYRMPGASPTPSAITPPDPNDLPAPYLNLADFPSTTTLALNSTLVPDERPSFPPRPTSMMSERRPPILPRSQPKARQSLTSLSSFSLSNMRPHSHSYSQSQSTSTSESASTTSTTTTSTHKSPPPNPTPTTQKPPKAKKQKIPLPTLNSTIPLSPATDLLTLTQHIETQISQARHLFSRKHNLLDPSEQSWISATIRDTEVATREVAVLTEGLRVEQAVNQGRLGVKTQVKWMLRDSKRAREKRERLVVVHQSLMTVLARLQGVQGAPAERGVEVGTETGLVSGNRSGSRNVSGQDRTDARDIQGSKLDSEEQVRRRRRITVDKAPTILSSTNRIPEDAPWDLSVQLQDAGMEAVVPNMVAEKVGPSVTTKSAGEISSTPSPKMDNELMDMLSWRWAQGRATT
ncbi:hypothetical protein BJX65DRAFT_90042 [Aspergillus insuetus]